MREYDCLSILSACCPVNLFSFADSPMPACTFHNQGHYPRVWRERERIRMPRIEGTSRSEAMALAARHVWTDRLMHKILNSGRFNLRQNFFLRIERRISFFHYYAMQYDHLRKSVITVSG